jgi:rod shape-determining protein MreC
MAGPRRGPRKLTIAVLVLLSLTVLTLDFRGVGAIDATRSAAATVFGPLRSGADWIATPFRNTWDGVFNYDDVRKENEELRARVEELEGQQVSDADAAAQFPDLLELLDIPWVGNINTATARVVSRPASNFSFVIDLDKGSEAGIKEGMPVVTGSGLVGRITLVTPGRSQVQLISDPDFRVGVRVVATQELGTARGRGSGRSLLVDTSIDPKVGIEPGAQLTTSGTDRSAFPQSIPVGEVTGTRDASGGLVLDLFADPYADLDTLTYVNVLLWEGVE